MLSVLSWSENRWTAVEGMEMPTFKQKYREKPEKTNNPPESTEN